MIVGVWFKDRQWCEKWFADFLSKINYDAVDRVIQSKIQPPKIIMKNGNLIKGIPATDNSRGHKMDVAYLEPRIRDSDIFYYVIQFTVVTIDDTFERGYRYKRGQIYEGFYGRQVKLDQLPENGEQSIS